MARLLAAVAVLFDHFAQAHFSGGFLWQMHALGSPAVDMFFVMSGFVISYVSNTPRANPTQYSVERASRILSVAVPAIVATFILDALGRWLSPTIYHWHDYDPGGWLSQGLLGLTFLNETWFGHIRIGSNSPYWSMGYEVWYYVIFGLAMFGTGIWRWLVVPAALLVAGPRVVALFPLWLIGVATQRWCVHGKMPAWIGLALTTSILVGTISALSYAVIYNAMPTPLPIYERTPTQLGPDYIIGTMFALTIAGVFFAEPLIGRVVRKGETWVAAAAGLTFTLYLFHFPLIAFFRACSPWPAASWQNRGMILASTVIVVIIVSYVTEQKRYVLREILYRIVSSLRMGKAVPLSPADPFHKPGR